MSCQSKLGDKNPSQVRNGFATQTRRSAHRSNASEATEVGSIRELRGVKQGKTYRSHTQRHVAGSAPGKRYRGRKTSRRRYTSEKHQATVQVEKRGAGSGCTPGEHDARFPIYMRLFREPKRDLPQHLTQGLILIPSKPIAGKGHEGRKSDATRRSVRTSDANPGRLRSQ